jgi:hypothetical protein
VLVGPTAGASQAVELWRALARHLTLGNADLAAQPDAASRNSSADWYLIGDLGVTVDALIVLDQRLAAGRHLPRKPARSYLEDRLAVGGVTSVAAWRGTDTSPDHALGELTGSLNEGVRLIRRPEDYAPAQRTLAGFMRPRPIAETHDLFGGRPGLHAARTIAAGQVRLAEAFATWAERADDPALAERFRSRVPKYVELHRSTLRLVELEETRSDLVEHQQSEMVQQLRKHRAARLSKLSLYDLDAATHELTVNVGRSLRREGMQRKNILVLDTGRNHLPVPAPSRTAATASTSPAEPSPARMLTQRRWPPRLDSIATD